MKSNSNVTAENPTILAVSCAGGIGQQFRVQVRGRDKTSWNLAGSFRDSGSAEACAEGLKQSGQQARIVAWRTLPTAA